GGPTRSRSPSRRGASVRGGSSPTVSTKSGAVVWAPGPIATRRGSHDGGRGRGNCCPPVRLQTIASLRPRSAPYFWVRGLPASSTCSVFAWPDGNVPTATATRLIHMVEVSHPVATLEWDTPLYRQARSQLEQALLQADIPEWVAERLRYPERALILTLPVKLDDGSVRSFPAYRVQHSSVLGPTKGGVRYDAEVNLGECAALAMWMTWKCSLLRLPYGGAKGGVRCNPRELSEAEIRRITRRFTADLAPFIGPDQDIPAPDMATNEQTMAWMMDTYSVQKGYAVPEIVTGKPVSIGGSLFRHEATGAGVVMVIERACSRLGWQL